MPIRYEWMLRHAEAVKAEAGSPWPYTQPTWVFTHRVLPRIEGADIRFVQGDVRTVHADMVRVMSPPWVPLSVRQVGTGFAALR